MIRHWQSEDIPAVILIEEKTQLAPWSLQTFEQCFVLNYLGWVLEEKSTIIGFAVASLQAGECHILNICIDPPFQNQGKGRELFAHVLASAKVCGAEIAYLEVRRSNVHAIRLYRKMGFSEVGQRKEYYPGTPRREDALVLALDLINYI